MLKRAELILENLETQAPERTTTAEAGAISNANINGVTGKGKSSSAAANTSGQGASADLFSSSVLADLLAIDVMSMSPIEALNVLYKLQEDARKGGGK